MRTIAKTLLVLGSVLVGCTAPVTTEGRRSTTSRLDLPPVADLDKDGSPDAEDCDPQSSNLGKRFLEDDLASAKGAIQAAPGFSQTAWGHENGAYRQSVVRNSGDASLFAVTTDGDLLIEATAALTKTGTYNMVDRQTLLIVGALATADSFSAYGCGIELVGASARTSIVKLSGSPGAIRTTTIEKVERDFIEVGQEFDVAVRVVAGKLTCTVTHAAATTTLEAPDVDAAVAGSAIGFYTRQGAALFKDARICRTNP